MNANQDGKPATDKKSDQKSGYKDRFWIPRFWDGMCFSGWVRLIARNRFAVSPKRAAMAVLVASIGVFNGALWAVQWLMFRRKIERTEIKGDPIFVIGHWRSGTTLLHELFVLDARHTYPDTYACFAPNHFLVSSWCIKPWLRFLLPAQRPMDNMLAGWDHPQEDEFALCNMGVPSPYLTNAFPNRPPQYPEYLDLRNVPGPDVARWKASLLWFLKCVTVRHPKRIVLKSPPHTARVRTLLEMFPNAKFVHIVRDPYVIFPSTVNLWKRLYRDEGIQVPTYEGLDEHVFATLTRMYDAFEQDRELLAKGQFCEVRYEELVAGPVAQMRRVYQELELGDFEAVRPAIENYFADKKGYKTNRYEMTPELHAQITQRWATFIEQYGYAGEPSPKAQPEKSESSGRPTTPAAKKSVAVS